MEPHHIARIFSKLPVRYEILFEKMLKIWKNQDKVILNHEQPINSINNLSTKQPNLITINNNENSTSTSSSNIVSITTTIYVLQTLYMPNKNKSFVKNVRLLNLVFFTHFNNA